MNCCPNCFKDKEIQAIIENNSHEIGDCNLCGKYNTVIIDLRELAESFEPLIKLFQVGDGPDAGFLSSFIQLDWQVFNLDNNKISIALIEMFSGTSWQKQGLFEKSVRRIDLSAKSTADQLKKWSSFKSEIKEKNRFFIQELIELDLLANHLGEHAIIYPAGQLFFRGRITKPEGVSPDKIGKPPKERTNPGRANPEGIPYLYLANDEKTTIYEVRSSYLNFVTIGTFRAKEKLHIVRLREIENKSPFQVSDLAKYAMNKVFLLALERELSKPLRRYDSELDYLPTQYLCEFIKSKGYDGIECGSSLNHGGANLAIFNDEKLECFETKVVEIKSITKKEKKYLVLNPWEQ